MIMKYNRTRKSNKEYILYVKLERKNVPYLSVKVYFQYKNRGILAKLMLNHIDNKI